MSDEKTVHDVSTTSAVDLARAIVEMMTGVGNFRTGRATVRLTPSPRSWRGRRTAKPAGERRAKVENRRHVLTDTVGNMDDTVAIVGLRLKPEKAKT